MMLSDILAQLKLFLASPSLRSNASFHLSCGALRTNTCFSAEKLEKKLEPSETIGLISNVVATPGSTSNLGSLTVLIVLRLILT